jgi:hypothetical protein
LTPQIHSLQGDSEIVDGGGEGLAASITREEGDRPSLPVHPSVRPVWGNKTDPVSFIALSIEGPISTRLDSWLNDFHLLSNFYHWTLDDPALTLPAILPFLFAFLTHRVL